jgi:hypothetical protein
MGGFKGRLGALSSWRTPRCCRQRRSTITPTGVGGWGAGRCGGACTPRRAGRCGRCVSQSVRCRLTGHGLGDYSIPPTLPRTATNDERQAIATGYVEPAGEDNSHRGPAGSPPAAANNKRVPPYFRTDLPPLCSPRPCLDLCGPPPPPSQIFWVLDFWFPDFLLALYFVWYNFVKIHKGDGRRHHRQAVVG